MGFRVCAQSLNMSRFIWGLKAPPKYLSTSLLFWCTRSACISIHKQGNNFNRILYLCAIPLMQGLGSLTWCTRTEIIVGKSGLSNLLYICDVMKTYRGNTSGGLWLMLMETETYCSAQKVTRKQRLVVRNKGNENFKMGLPKIPPSFILEVLCPTCKV